MRVAATRTTALLATLALVVAGAIPTTATASAENIRWSGAEQPIAPGASWQIPLGSIGDIEFWAPNRGLLITAGNGPTVPAGVWAYNGVEWHELATVCGATDGRIAWAGPSEFWTVSDGRAGQANESSGSLEKPPPLEDNTLCHFAAGQLVASYAHPAFEPDSYGAMHSAACLSPVDCWFAGDPLESPQIGSFHLHWNGSSLEAEPYLGEGHPVEDMRDYEGRLYESVRISSGDARVNREQIEQPAVHKINPEGVQPIFQPEHDLPLYGIGELPEALDSLHLSAADGALWGAAGAKRAEAGEAGQMTVIRRAAGVWTQLIGPETPLGPILADRSEETELLGGEAKNAQVSAIAAEPGTGSAWLALTAPPGSGSPSRAVLVHLSAAGSLIEAQALPSLGEQEQGIGPKGAADKLSCPAVHDCWLATTRGWLFHLAPEHERSLPTDQLEDEYFTGLVTFRPPDQGLPQLPPDAPPPDDSGLVEAPPNYGGAFSESQGSAAQSKVTLPLLSHMHSRLVHGSTLELRFHLAVKARIRLIAQRRRQVVASTATRTFAAGDRKLLLRLDRRRWPTKLSLQSHALAPLPRVPSASGQGVGVNTESTGLFTLPRALLQSGLGTPP